MSLATGVKLGPYEILASIGAGGMGEVYRARDTRLGRDVAVKVSAEKFSDRFGREARVVASLNHPNICGLFDVGPNYLVMEFVSGESPRGPLPVETALRYARQLAAALDAAHSKGIIHRDLKPANIKITPEGNLKVLDFGLAKISAGADQPGGAPVSPEDSPTFTVDATQAGVILGTAAYMSPEQARGKPVDKRTDVWAFGVVLFELLTGKPLFAGETVSDTLAKVIMDPAKRLRDIGDFAALLEEPAELPPPPDKTRAAPQWLWAVAAPACLVAAGLGFVHFREKQATRPEVIRFQIRPPDGVSFTRSGSFALSPDGRRLVYSAAGRDGQPGIWLQDLDAVAARPLPDTLTGPIPPPFFWSPDSRFVAFSHQSDKLRKADVGRGVSLDVLDKPGPPIGGSWNQDGVIIFGSMNTGLWRGSATSNQKPVPLTALDPARHERYHQLPCFLPDGKHFLYYRGASATEESGIFSGSLDDPPERQSRRPIVTTGFGASFVPADSGGPGLLFFLRNDSLMAQGFNPDRLELIGTASLVAEHVGTIYQTALFSASAGALVYRPQVENRTSQIAWFDRQGKLIENVGSPIAADIFLRLSPSGRQALYFNNETQGGSESDIWLLDLARGSRTRFTYGTESRYAVWSPDGADIVFASNRAGTFQLYRRPANGGQKEELLLQSKLNSRPDDLSPDGRYLLYSTCPFPTFNSIYVDLWILPMQGDRTPIPFQRTPFLESAGAFSPDGRYVAYQSNESGQMEIYVKEFKVSAGSAEGGSKWVISKDGGRTPHWRSDGKELVYLRVDGEALMSVNVDTSKGFQAGEPRKLFGLPKGGRGVPAGDFKRFLLPILKEEAPQQVFQVVLNWRSLLPAK